MSHPVKPTVAQGRALGTLALLLCLVAPQRAQAQQAEPAPPGPGEPSGDEDPPSVAAPAAGVETPLTLADEAAELHLRGDYESAQPMLEKAYGELALPTIGIWLARNLDRLGRLLDAQDRYRAIVDEEESDTRATLSAAEARGLAPPPMKEQEEAKEDAELELERLVERIPTMVVAVEGDAGRAQVTLDGGPAPVGQPRQLDPGPYRVEGKLGDQTIVRAVVLHERDRATVGVPFRTEPVPGPDGTAQTVVGWVLVGVGGAAAVGGGILSAVAMGRLHQLDCPDNLCQPSQQDDVDAYNGLRLPAGFLLVGGGLLAATGVAIVLNAPADHEETASTTLSLGPGFVGLRGTF